MTKIITIFNFKKKIFHNEELKKVDENLNKEGYQVMEDLLDQNSILEVFKLTRLLKCFSRVDKNQTKDKIFHDLEIKYPTYTYTEEDLICQKPILEIVTNKKFIEIAKNYFGSEPILKNVNMWWSTNFLKEADSESAQMFHFDLDGIKWLKIFIYITDVNIENGPHVYVSNTHKSFEKPYDLMLRGYKRISDEDIKSRYDSSRIKTICGKAGTTIIGDTSCFHKGLPPKKESRLIFEYELSNSLFGSPYKENFNSLSKNINFNDYMEKNKNFFKKYI